MFFFPSTNQKGTEHVNEYRGVPFINIFFWCRHVMKIKAVGVFILAKQVSQKPITLILIIYLLLVLVPPSETYVLLIT
jgi:hypothetical protein